MKCPTCDDVELKMTDRQGIEIDYCPTCRGVWLDRGELDKIIERSVSDMGTRGPDRRDRDDDREDYDRGSYKKSKRRGFFGDLFDFD
jgi:Zn-finger nucleic acid-binding protein